MAEPAAVPDRLASAAATWCAVGAALVPSLPVRPDVAPSPEAHALATICVELVQPLAAAAARWSDGGSTAVLGRVEVKLRHLEATGAKAGRDLATGAAAAETRALLAELEVRSTAPKREAGAPGSWFLVSVDPDEALTGRQALLALAAALREGASGGRGAGSPDHRFRDGPAVLAFWSMKVETCSPGAVQPLVVRLARRSPRRAIAEATAELLARLQDEPSDPPSTSSHRDLVALCERTLADLD